MWKAIAGLILLALFVAQAVLIDLKLHDNIAAAWGWVFAPIWGSLLVAAIVSLLVLVATASEDDWLDDERWDWD